MRTHLSISLLCAAVILLIPEPLLAADPTGKVSRIPGLENSSVLEVTDLQVESGTLEPTEKGVLFGTGNLIFKSGKTTEKFEWFNVLAFYPEFIVRGWVFDDGTKLENRGEGPDKLSLRFAREHPGAKPVAYILAGSTEKRLEVRFQGQTPVYRVTIKIGGQKTVLWVNRDEAKNTPEPEPPKP